MAAMMVRTSDGTRLFTRVAGDGPQTVVLAHSFLSDHRHFDAQIEALSKHFRVVAYDHRGHGQSDKPRGPYNLDRLVADGCEIIEHFDAAPCHWVGLSTGGFVGMRIAHRHPELLRRLVLMDTSADCEPLWPKRKYQLMFMVLRLLGWGPLTGSVMNIMFGRSFMRDPKRAAEVAVWRARFSRQDNVPALEAFADAIFERESVLDALAAIATPTLVVVGDEDTATPPFRSERIVERIPGAVLETIPRAGHLSTVVNPEAVNAALLSFLTPD